MKESSIQNQIRLDLAKVGVKVFRNNVGTLKDARGQYVTYGLCPGSSDLIGWKSIKITKDMVGQTLAQFVAIEVKRPGGKITAQQLNFLHAVNKDGGIATVCHSTEEAMDAIS